MANPLKFLLINPTAPEWRAKPDGTPSAKTLIFRFSMLSSLYVAASLPSDVVPQILDEDVDSLNFNTDADLIGISFMTFNAPRAYEIADKFRSKGKKVIVGGYHPSLLPQEAARHADAVCIGEAEAVVPNIIDDFRHGTLKQFYKSEPFPLDGLPIPNRSLIQTGSYAPVDAVQATRGCPHSCTFCSIASFSGRRFRKRPIDEVISELRTLHKYLLFMDDNITADRNHAEELFRRMVPLRKRWFSQASIKIAYDTPLLKAAAESGCSGLFIGFESLAQENLRQWNKRINAAKDYEWAIRRLHDYGIGIIAGIVFGYDWDEPGVFDQTLDFLYRINADALQATILTPFPGTPLYDEMNHAGRITDRDWTHYNFRHVVFDPLHMSPDQLRAGHDRVLTAFYSPKSVTRRLLREFSYLSPVVITKATLPLNLSYRARLRTDGTIPF
jgi:radical SAM superfamily enzyme YgiQ (UPF0313 family)